jgi:hypothetical protein
LGGAGWGGVGGGRCPNGVCCYAGACSSKYFLQVCTLTHAHTDPSTDGRTNSLIENSIEAGILLGGIARALIRSECSRPRHARPSSRGERESRCAGGAVGRDCPAHSRAGRSGARPGDASGARLRVGRADRLGCRPRAAPRAAGRHGHRQRHWQTKRMRNIQQHRNRFDASGFAQSAGRRSTRRLSTSSPWPAT